MFILYRCILKYEIIHGISDINPKVKSRDVNKLFDHSSLTAYK